jgi:hypothetical protein
LVVHHITKSKNGKSTQKRKRTPSFRIEFSENDKEKVEIIGKDLNYFLSLDCTCPKYDTSITQQISKYFPPK